VNQRRHILQFPIKKMNKDLQREKLFSKLDMLKSRAKYSAYLSRNRSKSRKRPLNNTYYNRSFRRRFSVSPLSRSKRRKAREIAFSKKEFGSPYHQRLIEKYSKNLYELDN